MKPVFSVPPSKLELINTDPGIAVNAGTERQISCRARDARPQARIVWYQGDKKIVDQGQVLSFYQAALIVQNDQFRDRLNSI